VAARRAPRRGRRISKPPALSEFTLSTSFVGPRQGRGYWGASRARGSRGGLAAVVRSAGTRGGTLSSSPWPAGPSRGGLWYNRGFMCRLRPGMQRQEGKKKEKPRISSPLPVDFEKMRTRPRAPRGKSANFSACRALRCSRAWLVSY